MFQFSAFARVSRDQCLFDSFPRLFAVFHALHSLLAPRHPPHALSSLTTLILAFRPSPMQNHPSETSPPAQSLTDPNPKTIRYDSTTNPPSHCWPENPAASSFTICLFLRAKTFLTRSGRAHSHPACCHVDNHARHPCTHILKSHRKKDATLANYQIVKEQTPPMRPLSSRSRRQLLDGLKRKRITLTFAAASNHPVALPLLDPKLPRDIFNSRSLRHRGDAILGGENPVVKRSADYFHFRRAKTTAGVTSPSNLAS